MSGKPAKGWWQDAIERVAETARGLVEKVQAGFDSLNRGIAERSNELGGKLSPRPVKVLVRY